MIETARAPAAAAAAGGAAEAEPRSRPLIALVSSFGGKSYTLNAAHGVGKAATDRLAADMSVQLAAHGVDALSLYPGLVRTEGNLEMDVEAFPDAELRLELAQGDAA